MAPLETVAILYGGRSAEHDVSRVTASAVANALDKSRYRPILIGIGVDGRWLRNVDAEASLNAGTEAPSSGLLVEGRHVVLPPDPTTGGLLDLESGEWTHISAVIPMLHGPLGEDGTVQGLCELANLAYAGCSVVGSAVGSDKIMMKRAFRDAGIPTAQWIEVRRGEPVNAGEVIAQLGSPVFVKPSNMGSSVGVSKAFDESELLEALDLAFRYDSWALIEEAIEGREIEIGVIGDNDLSLSVPGEVRPGSDFYTYEDKYEDAVAELLIPAPISDDELNEMKRLAEAAYRACRADGMARVDFFYDEGVRGWLANEVNTIPGFTPFSMFPRLFAASGVSYAALIDRVVADAKVRQQSRATNVGQQRPGK
jgi:D-alanine-D-alanine ligase